ncbi:MAG TPA: endonuclease/exonuclease/phosphatase family protein [Burkholderiales bacterium]|nr:endonuclease/exonuclease/phosphatase family protein [Burkholderiales bacterium]
MSDTLHIATYNIHKGLSFFNRRLVIHDVRERLCKLDADLVFLQEVQGDPTHHARRHDHNPRQPQHEFLAGGGWGDFAYGRNAIYDGGHHGNAILSRFPLMRWDNEDISAHRFEQRGLLHCEIQVPGWTEVLHCVCVHLGLFSRYRSRQLRALRARIERLVPPQAPLIVAGDFNDWSRRGHRELARPLGLEEVFEQAHGRFARSFPARLPLLPLDRIYVRGFTVERAHAHHGRLWAPVSDHAALTSTIVRK